MDEILQKYKLGKFHDCLELLNSLPAADSIVENLILENCKLLCEAFIRKTKNDPDKIYEMQEQLYLFYDKVTSLGTLPEPNFEELKLVVTYNFIYWLVLYNGDDISDFELEEYLEVISESISRVSGKRKPYVLYSDSTSKLLDNLSSLSDLSRSENMFMYLEFIIVLILFIIKLKGTLVSDCLKIIKKLTNGLKIQVKSKAAMDEFLRAGCELPNQPPLFKFSLDGTPEILEMKQNIVDYIYLLESTLLFLQEDYIESLKSLQRNIHSSVPSLWTYLVVLNASELEKWDLCSGFLVKSESLVLQTNLKARYCILQGNMESIQRNHKNAVQYYKEATELSPMCPAVWYFLGREYGRMGLYDLTLENFQKLIEVVTDEDFEFDLSTNFETTLLDWIHPPEEITELEAYYALAVAYGMKEKFREAAETFDKVLQWSPTEYSKKKNRIIQLPNYLTILHDAATMNIRTGDPDRAEQIAMDAIDQYLPRASTPGKVQSSLMCKDAEWLERLIYKELLETDMEPRELSTEIIYTEDLIFGLNQNVIGMLILSEIQRIQDEDDYKQTLSSVFSTFSKYLAAAGKKNSEESEELTLVKALAGKTCLKIAAVQMKGKGESQVEKMFKRALSCNQGDKDALHGYYTFLTKLGRHSEAVRLWNTFAKEKSTISVDSLTSFFLKYFLTDKISKRELDRIQAMIDLTDIKIF